jgi:hypothetical protein
MSDPSVNEAPDNERSYEPSKELLGDLDRVRRRALPIAIGGAVLCIAGAALDPSQLLRSYLIAVMFWLSIAAGCSAILMLQYVARGAWGVVTRRTLEAASRTLPALGLLFTPILIGLPRLYIWADESIAHADPHIHHKAAYLNVPFFIGRALFYFVVWSAFAFALNRLSNEQDRTGDPNLQERTRRVSALGLIAYCVTMTFAAFDWLMSLSPHWVSSIFGVYVIGGQGVATMAFAVIAALFLSRREPMASALRTRHFHDLGKLLLAFVMLWSYFGISQFLIIWSGNLPEDSPWFIDRMRGGYKWVSLALVAFHFALPFMILLSRDTKRNAKRLASVAGFLLVMRLVDLYWLVAPAFHPKQVVVHPLDLLAPITIGAIWVWLVAGELKKKPLLPAREPMLAEALHDG